MANHTFNHTGADYDMDVFIGHFYGKDYICTNLHPDGLRMIGYFNLTAKDARAYAADLIAHADALNEGNVKVQKESSE